jgi:XrtJ-associated TM-motif-TM protein
MQNPMKSAAGLYALVLVLFMAVAASPAFGQNGCVDSPENPTAVLAVAGSAGAIVVAIRQRLRRR